MTDSSWSLHFEGEHRFKALHHSSIAGSPYSTVILRIELGEHIISSQQGSDRAESWVRRNGKGTFTEIAFPSFSCLSHVQNDEKKWNSRGVGGKKGLSVTGPDSPVKIVCTLSTTSVRWERGPHCTFADFDCGIMITLHHRI